MKRRSGSKKGKAPGKPSRPPAPRPEDVPVRWYALAAVILMAVTLLAYRNTLDNEFVSFDDRKYIYENHSVTDGSLKEIWGDLWNERPTIHYYPLTFTTFWIERKLFGLEPEDAGRREIVGRAAHPVFHATQMVLHGCNAILLLFLLRALGAGFLASAFTAAIFAVHPVNVASVAWVSERRNLLSSFFFFLALLLYAEYRRRSRKEPRRSGGDRPGTARWYVLSLCSYACALLSKAAAMTLAPLILLTDRLLFDRRWTRGALLRSIPFFAGALVMALLTMSREAVLAKQSSPVDFHLRPFIAAAALVHYVTKMILPVNQVLIYPRWAESLAEPRYWIAALAVIGASFLVWRYRGWLGGLWLWGLGLFLLTVAPVLGLKDFNWMIQSFVSDHYLYLGSAGLALAAGLLLQRWVRAGQEAETPRQDLPGGFRSLRPAVFAVLTVVLVAACVTRTVRQNRTWKNNLTLYSHTLTVNPDSFSAHYNLGNHYKRLKDWEKAIPFYTACSRIEPDFIRSMWNCAICARALGREEEAIAFYKDAVARADRKNPRSWRIRTEYAGYLKRLGRLEDALEEYKLVLARKPPNIKKVATKIREVESLLDR